jgi:2-oxoglutarate ferredoxin oxidoreductase subunit gamma
MSDSPARQIEIVFSGQGGQGVRLVSTLLGRACATAGKQVASSASYGPEVRGSHTRSEVIVSDALIVYPRVLHPTILVALSQEGYNRAYAEVPADGCILYEAEAVTPAAGVAAQQFPISAIRIASELGDAGSANMVMLGAVAALAELIDLHALLAALPAGRRTQNEAALRRGYALGAELRRQTAQPNTV